MDPRVAWIQPEQKGPANTLWMHVWETSNSQNPRMNLPMAPGLVKTNSSNCMSISPQHLQVPTGFPPLPPPFAPCNLPVLANPVPGPGKAGSSPQNGSLSPSSPVDSDTDSPKSDTCNSTRSQHPHPHPHPPRFYLSFTEQLHNLNNYLHHQHLHLQSQLPHHHHYQRHQSQHIPPVPIDQHHPVRKKNENQTGTYGINYLLSNSNDNHFCPGSPWRTRRYSPGVDGYVHVEVNKIFTHLILVYDGYIGTL